MFSILYVFFFTAYQARITWRNRELSGRESTFLDNLKLNQISVNII